MGDAAIDTSRIEHFGLTREEAAILFDQKKKIANQAWRINNLYKIKNDDGQVVDFVMNDAQEELYYEQWYRNLILKARQLGFTTFIDILCLDTCMFNPNIESGIIAHHRDDANKIFKNKIKFAYDNMPSLYRKLNPSTTDRAGHIVFQNGSSIEVSTSFRSGTLQFLHVSEMGKIAAKYPERAREIITGAFEAVHATGNQKIFVESTAEGREGAFYSLATKAQQLKDSGARLTRPDFKFHFFPWWQKPSYKMDPDGVVFTEEHLTYFKDLKSKGITLSVEQQAWWIKKFESLNEDIYREHPSHPEEAFKASVEGAYYGQTIVRLRRAGRIGKVPYEPGFPVHTCWDLGMDDSTTIWAFQQVSRELRIINYHEDQDQELAEYAKVLNGWGYSYGTHYLPHDVGQRELGTGKTRKVVLENLGVRPITRVDRPKNTDQLIDQINETRNFLARCWIDEANCDKGIKCLENYRREWDEKLGAFKRTPLHSYASHGADGLRTGAAGFTSVLIQIQKDLLPPELPDH